MVDVTKSGTSTTYDQQLLENLPKTRFTYIDIMAWAPGISMNENGQRGMALVPRLGLFVG